MSAIQYHRNPYPILHCFYSRSPKLLNFLNPNSLVPINNKLFLKEVRKKSRVSISRDNTRNWNYYSLCCKCKQNSDQELELVEKKEDEIERPPFDINLAVVLAGFAFEAYTSPPENVGKQEVDPAGCQTVFLSELFLREAYDGQLLIKLKKGVDFPAMDPWGTSDPYVVMQLDGQIVKSKIKWATKDPTWNEDFTLNIKISPSRNLQVAAWDANLVAPHKRMGNSSISLESLCDGNLHEVLVELGGMGGGGKLHLEVKYRSFDEADKEKQSWGIPFISDLLAKNNLGPALQKVLGTDTIQTRQFVEYAFGQLRSFDFSSQKNQDPNADVYDLENSGKSINSDGRLDTPLHEERVQDGSLDKGVNLLENNKNYDAKGDEITSETRVAESIPSSNYLWDNFADILNHTVIQKLGVSLPEQIKWDGFDMLNKIGLQSKRIAEAGYIESGLAAPESQAGTDSRSEESSISKEVQSSAPDMRKVSWDVLKQTDSILGALVLLTTTFSQQKETNVEGTDSTSGGSVTVVDGVPSSSESTLSPIAESSLSQTKTEEMKQLFSTAESAMEAWAMLATSLGQNSFIKSEFEKICFIDNTSTDTQVAVWRDSSRKRLVVAFRGTEQVRWKDLRTDLMVVPVGLNPERIGGDFKQEVQVHSGFLTAYDSVRNKLMSIIKLSIGFKDDTAEDVSRWHIYVTGHSLGGALSTLLALELSSSHMAKCGAIAVTMYNFGSPRVGNKRFVDNYNEKVKDSWRVVNHRDIIPTVPRLMGYCHVAQPIYLSTGGITDALANMDLLADGYQADVIAEYTPDVLVSEFMKGEKDLIEKILQTEINIFRSIRDGTALNQHMEDFYYITLLEHVQSNYRIVGGGAGGASNSNGKETLPNNGC